MLRKLLHYNKTSNYNTCTAVHIDQPLNATSSPIRSSWHKCTLQRQNRRKHVRRCRLCKLRCSQEMLLKVNWRPSHNSSCDAKMKEKLIIRHLKQWNTTGIKLLSHGAPHFNVRQRKLLIKLVLRSQRERATICNFTLSPNRSSVLSFQFCLGINCASSY